jgi:hypothetical protein
MRGLPALALVEAVIEAVRAHLPPEVRSVKVRLFEGRSLQVWAVPAIVPPEVDYDFVEVRTDEIGGSVSTRGPEAPFGIGTWIPFVPSAIRYRMEVTDALDLLRDAVGRVVVNWPAEKAVTRARTDGKDVLVWFEDESGQQLLPEFRIGCVAR